MNEEGGHGRQHGRQDEGPDPEPVGPDPSPFGRPVVEAAAFSARPDPEAWSQRSARPAPTTMTMNATGIGPMLAVSTISVRDR
jgi:hypothetical protein